DDPLLRQVSLLRALNGIGIRSRTMLLDSEDAVRLQARVDGGEPVVELSAVDHAVEAAHHDGEVDRPLMTELRRLAVDGDRLDLAVHLGRALEQELNALRVERPSLFSRAIRVAVGDKELALL